MKNPRKFSWKITAVPRTDSKGGMAGKCSGGGNQCNSGNCCGKCGGKKTK